MFVVSELWTTRDECPFVDLIFFYLKHDFRCAISFNKRVGGLVYVIRDWFKGCDDGVKDFMSGHGGSGHFVLENVGIMRECIR
jgi:hypothetical protein